MNPAAASSHSARAEMTAAIGRWNIERGLQAPDDQHPAFDLRMKLAVAIIRRPGMANTLARLAITQSNNPGFFRLLENLLIKS